jgi:ATP-binding cassette subfamily B protein
MPQYFCIKQHDITDCGAACLAIVCKQHGLKIPITRIRELAGTDKQGTNAYGLVKAAEQLGFIAKGVKGDAEALFTPFPLPSIAHVIIDGGLMHYVVIHKITKNTIIIADPSQGIRKICPKDFFEEWTGVLIIMEPTPMFEKGDYSKSIWSRFFKLLIPQKSLLINIFFASLVYTILGIGAAFYFQIMMDEIIPNTLEQTLSIISIGIIALYLFKSLLGAIRTHMLLYMSQKLDINLILGYYSHVLALPMNFFGNRRVGEIISRFFDASKVREAISGATMTVMIDTFMAVIGGVILYMQNSRMFLVSAIVLLLYGIIVFSFNKPLLKVNHRTMEANAELTSYLVESLNGIETVKAFNAERATNIETEKKFIRLIREVFHNGILDNASGSLSSMISAVGGVVILWVGAVSVIRGDMTIGQLLTFNALLVYFLDPVKSLINLQPMMQTAIVASDRLGEILDLEVEKNESENKKATPDSLHKEIIMKNVDFRYGSRKQVLHNINFEIKAGEKIAFVGESGSGKTTLVKLLLNFYDWERGEILIGPYNIKDIKIEWLREKIAYISQDVFLFSGTIYENLVLGNTLNPSIEDVIHFATITNAHDFINSLPLRYETILEENGANLAGGQKQRLAITRALLKKPDILIIDEATSNLDSITEKAIERMIEEHTKGVTTLIIAHRLSTIIRCDKIFYMNDGQLKESGTHSELMQMQGHYYRLWKEQFSEGWGN